MQKLILAAALSFLALVVGSGARAAGPDPIAVLKQFSVDDLQAASDDAKANNDPSAQACWDALKVAVQTAQSPTPPKLGVFLALQKGRDAIRLADQTRAGIGPFAAAKTACADIIVDFNTFLLRLGVTGAGAVFKLP